MKLLILAIITIVTALPAVAETITFEANGHIRLTSSLSKSDRREIRPTLMSDFQETKNR